MLKPKRSTTRNLAAMFAWQGMNYVLPLVTLPYLARVLQPAEFGLLGFATSVIAYATLFTDWGFALSATQQVAVNREDPEALTDIFWSTLLAKALLAGLSLLVILVLMAVVPVLRDHAWLLLAAWLQVPGGVLTVSWYLQGMERLAPFATAAIIGRCLPIPFLFLLVHSPQDVAVAALLQSAAGLATGAISLRMALGTRRIGAMRFSIRTALGLLRGSTVLFLANVSVSAYSNLNTVILSAVAGPVQTGLFVGADKLRQAVQGLITPMATVMFPKISGLAAQDSGATLALIKRLLVVQGSFSAMLSIGTWITAPWVVPILLGPGYGDAVDVLRALAPVPFLVGLNNVLGIQFMLPFGYRREFLFTIAFSGAISLLYMPLLAYNDGAVGVALALSITEAMVNVVAVAVIYLRRHHIRLTVQAGGVV